jgi:hypothetical protein
VVDLMREGGVVLVQETILAAEHRSPHDVCTSSGEIFKGDWRRSVAP